MPYAKPTDPGGLAVYNKRQNEYSRRWRARPGNKERQLAYQKSQRQLRFDILSEWKKLEGCARCGYCKSAAALDWHHKDPTQKEFGVTQQPNLSWDRILTEAAKCEVLCANCHREEHFESRPHPA